ncbi:MAG: L,D-transpeptidase [Hyphomicrobiaceae bacterium]
MRRAFAATLAAFAILAPAAAMAQGWSGGAPVFRSDVEKREREAEARREAIRKSAGPVVYPRYMKGGDKPDITPEKPPIVYLNQPEQVGTVIVDTAGRKLYYVLDAGRAYAYPISVGRDGFTWTGTEKISRIASWPTWTPPPEMRQRVKGLPITVTGGLINPLGAKALYLGNSIYRIHGTSNDRSIGRASSSGCFRMMNKHVVHLASIVKIGTKVRVVKSYPNVSESAPLSALFSGFGGDDPSPVTSTAKSKSKKKPKKATRSASVRATAKTQ